MRPVHVTHQYRPAIGGAEEYITKLSEALAGRGHEVHVYTANSTDYMTWTGDLPAREMLGGVHVHRFRAIPRRERTWALLRRGLYPYLERPRRRYEPLIMIGNGPTCPGLFLNLATVGRGYDLVHLNSLHYAHTAYGYAAARMAGRPVAVTPNVHVEQRETWDVGYMKHILAHADLIFAQTEYERRFHMSQGRDPDWVVTCGVGLNLADYPSVDQAEARRRLGIAPGSEVVLCIGRQVEYKGTDKVLATCRELRSSHPNLLVLVVGPESEWSRKMMADYDGLPWVRNLGQVDDATKLASLSAADFLAMPSHGESFGITYLESWLAARPVIGLRKGAVQDLISDGEDGYLTPPDDEAALRQAIAALLDDPARAAEMGRCGRVKTLRRYTLDVITDIVEGAYRRLLEAKDKDMRVSIINLNLVAKDAVGKSITEQARFFSGRGDTVCIFIEHAPEGAPEEIAALCQIVTLGDLQRDESGLFAASDVYIYHYPSRYSLMETITGIDGGLVIFNYHNVTPPELWNREEERHILRNGVEGVTLATYADLVVGDSRFNLDDLAGRVSFADDRLVELPLPVDTSQFCPGSASEALRRQYAPHDEPVLLYVGRMASNKRIDLLVEVLAAVRSHPANPQPNARLLLVGDYASAPAYKEEARRAEKLARERGVAGAVVFAGRVDNLPDYYRLASIYVTSSQHEGFCVPLIEAMASGLPIVAADCTAIPGTLAGAGRLTPTDDAGMVNVQAMADAVAEVLADPALADDLRRRGLERANNFTVEKYRERLAEIVDRYAVNLPLRAQPITPRRPAADEPAPAERPGAQDAYWPELNKEARVAMSEYSIRSRVPVVGGMIAWTRRNMTSHLKEPYLDLIIFRQQAFNLRSAWIMNELTRRWEQLGAHVNARLDEVREQLDGALEQTRGYLDTEIERYKARQFRIESQLTRIESRLATAETAEAAPPPGARQDLEPAPQQAYAVNYMSCNEAVGGALQDEMALYGDYVLLFRGQTGPVLDLGCGRGAFLALMQQEHLDAAGVDIDPAMVDFCRAQGFAADEGDVFEALRGRADGSLGGIFCAHVVEHLPRTRLMELAGLCWQKLQPGAAVVWITPNGGSLAALHATFYKDLTHTRPLHPDLLAFIFESSGFVGVETTTLSDMPAESKLQLVPHDGDQAADIMNENIGRLNRLLFGHVDCAVAGRRPPDN